MFRGQTRDWPLLPRIGRYPKGVLGSDNWSGFHEHVIEEFLRVGLPYFPRYPKTAPESWVIA